MRGSNLLSRLSTRLGVAALTLLPGALWAQDAEQYVGKPVDGKMGFQVAASDIAADIHWLDHMVTLIVSVIVALVLILLAIVILRYNSRVNPTPKKFTHNTPVEVAWTLIPVVILVVIGAFSLPILFNQQEFPKGDIVVKVTGHQWYWSYEYVDEAVAFDSYLLGHPANVTAEDEAAGVVAYVNSDAMKKKLVAAGYSEDEFLLAVDNPVVIPLGAVVVMQVTGADVIHSWTVPAFGVKQDGVPGRIAQLWFKPTKEGIFFGQCSELCGKDHAYMPIAVKVVSEDEYKAWLEKAKTDFPA